MTLREKPKITLLGATGFLGSAIAEVLEEMGIPWIGVCISKQERANIITLSPDDKQSLVNIINEYPIVINATGSLKPRDFEKRTTESLELFWKNVEHFVEILEHSNVQLLVHLSSAGTVYGDSDSKEAFDEGAILKPISWYGKAKALEEYHYEKVASLVGFKYICARITNPFGNKEKARHGFIDVLLHSMRENTEFNYFADCDPMRDFIFAPDMSQIIMKLVLNEHFGIFNIGSGEPMNISRIANYVKQRVDNPHLINRTLAKPHYDVLNSIVSVNKIKEIKVYVNTVNVYEYIDSHLKRL